MILYRVSHTPYITELVLSGKISTLRALRSHIEKCRPLPSHSKKAGFLEHFVCVIGDCRDPFDDELCLDVYNV